MSIQKEILLLLDNEGLDIFTNLMIKDKLSLSLPRINEALHRLTRNNIIKQLERGKYCRHNFSDAYVIGCFLAKEGVIAYWTALHFHGLTEQIPNVIFVQTTQAKRNKSIFGVRYRFIRVKEQKLIGGKSYGYGNHKFLVTDTEKTIVDCFDLPKYGGGYNEIIKGFNNAKLSAQKLVKYCKAIDNIAITKRLAFLCELLEKPDMEYFLRYARSILNENYDLFESDGEETGKTNRSWRLKINMDEAEIIEIANS